MNSKKMNRREFLKAGLAGTAGVVAANAGLTYRCSGIANLPFVNSTIIIDRDVGTIFPISSIDSRGFCISVFMPT